MPKHPTLYHACHGQGVCSERCRHDALQEVISEKKLDKWDGGWSQQKEILGWVLDSKRRTLELMDWRLKWIMDIFEDLCRWNRVRVKKWQQVLGELQFMGLVVPGLAGLFGSLQLGLSHVDKHWVKITCFLCDHLTDFEALAHDISLQLMRLAEVVLDYLLVIGLVDTTKLGMGDIIFAPGHPPTLWCATFPPEIQQCIILVDNPSGDLTNSDLEQASILAQADVAAFLDDICKLTLATLNDNSATIARNQKGAITSDHTAAYICHRSSLHCQHH